MIQGTTDKPLRITAFVDGRPGHEKQTRGIVNALARLTDVAVEYVPVGRRGIGRELANWLRLLHIPLPDPNRPVARKCDLVIGTGSATHIPMLLLKRRSGARAVTCMAPDLLLRRAMDLCFVPRHDGLAADANIFLTTGPPGTAIAGHHHDPGRGLILIGGVDEKSHYWDSFDIIQMVETLIQKYPSFSWTISSSPRTDLQTVDFLARIAENHDNVVFYRVEDTPAGWIEEAYQQHGTVWVTADSMSMVYEALSASCRVGILPVRWKKHQSKFRNSIDYLVAEQLVQTYEDILTDGEVVARSSHLDEASRCAKEILRRWWPDRLP
ncbi:mitochondrial fission ELM1 family protein [Desulfolithobacter sp.]